MKEHQLVESFLPRFLQPSTSASSLLEALRNKVQRILKEEESEHKRVDAPILTRHLKSKKACYDLSVPASRPLDDDDRLWIAANF